MPRPKISTVTLPTATPTALLSRTVLIAVLGSSPAVLTETLWALAQENPPTFPDEIAVVTTTHGEATLRQELLTPRSDWADRTVWQALRRALLGPAAEHSPKLTLAPPIVIALADPASGTARPLDDIRTAAENSAAGEEILATVRKFATPETRLLGLLAGGRKTMGALLHAALSLAGREGDRILHVLVDTPFDDPRLAPRFYFPGQPGPATLALSGSKLRARHAAARPALADVPLVALGELVARHAGHAPGTFAGFCRAAGSALADAQAATASLTVCFDSKVRHLAVNLWEAAIPPGRAAVFCEQLCRAALRDEELLDRRTIEEAWEKAGIRYPRPDTTETTFNEGDISNSLNVLRDQLAAAGAPAAVIDRLFPRRAPIGLNRPGVTVSII